MTLITELKNIGQRTIGRIDDRVYYYQHQNGSIVFKNRPYYKPVQPGSIDQIKIWDRFKVGVSAWHNMDQAQVKTWNDKVSRLAYSMTGYNLFLSFILRGKFDMIKSIQHNAVLLNNGDNSVVISTVDPNKSIVLINTFLTTWYDTQVHSYGITGAGFVDSTHILIQALKVNLTINLFGYYQVIEFL